jgi:predicted dehydrogenase
MNSVIIGFGNIAIKHLEVARNIGINIIASSNRNKFGNELARQHGINKTYSNYIEMVEKEKPDSIIICVSFELLYSVCKSLIPYKIPILLEKPAGTCLEELHDLIELSNKFGSLVQVAMNRRHYDVIHKAIEHAGGIEKIMAVDVEWSENPRRVLEEKGYSREQTAKLIYGNSIHGIDMALFYGGSIENPYILTKDYGEIFRWYMQFSGESKSGKLVNFRSSWDHPVPWRLVLSSEDKRYVFAPLENGKIYFNSKSIVENIEVKTKVSSFKAGFLEQMQTFKNLVEKTKYENIHNLESCLPAMKIAEKFYSKFNS